jgi:hypothetical protein
LSLPSAHWASNDSGNPQSAVQLQEVSAGSHVLLPQQAGRQAASAQSAVPLQSLSSPSVQLVSDGGSAPQSAGQTPLHRSDGVQVPLPQVLPKLHEMPNTLPQSA